MQCVVGAKWAEDAEFRVSRAIRSAPGSSELVAEVYTGRLLPQGYSCVVIILPGSAKKGEVRAWMDLLRTRLAAIAPDNMPIGLQLKPERGIWHQTAKILWRKYCIAEVLTDA